jgi:Flp pilus assembly protein TadG
MKLNHSTMPASRSRLRRRGAAVIEFAVVAPLFALWLLGMIELSRALMVKVMLSDAARKGCRTGIHRDKANTDIISDCTDVMRDNNFTSGQFNPNSIGSIAITVTDPNGNVLSDTLDAPSGSIVSVQVSIPVASIIWVPSIFMPAASFESETAVMMKQ